MTRTEFEKRVAMEAFGSSHGLFDDSQRVVTATLTVAAEIADRMFDKDYDHSQRKYGAKNVAAALKALTTKEQT